MNENYTSMNKEKWRNHENYIKGPSTISRTYFSLDPESSQEENTDITFDSGKREDIILPIFKSHLEKRTMRNEKKDNEVKKRKEKR